MSTQLFERVRSCVENFIKWLGRYGETSYDHQSFFAGPLGRRLKTLYYEKPLLGIVGVSPLIICEAFVPSARRLFWRKQRFPIADAHYAMGFALLADSGQRNGHYLRAVHFLEELERSRAPGFERHCWGYPFDWVTRNGTIPANTPFITTLPYVYEAFEMVYQIDRDERWLAVMQSIAMHALHDIKDFEVSPGAYACGYGPYDNQGGVVNASAYRAFLLSCAYLQFSDERYREAADGNIEFIVQAQRADGSWPYAVGDTRDFVDHFHTCFVLKALAKIDARIDNENCRKAIDRGVEYYLANLLDEEGLPKPFSRAPRMTVYRRELYDYAECINVCLLLREHIPELNRVLDRIIEDVLYRWIKPDGSFRSRELFFGWDNVPMHRWAQSQMFRSLAFLLQKEMNNAAQRPGERGDNRNA